ncbi:DUF4214 domain-containing protein [Massilia sp. MS-15]|uniref:DUF4214 domain-containing protein n=1 Tax=Massilia sp. MS-15 TaxID=2878200 RepID=UPI001CD32386|nr:DUF4214 domain-containing protein [Massilia sp. MS-15]MCA1248324.1 DUF4214 domain-containing protein [Massilia sp. MS-15]
MSIYTNDLQSLYIAYFNRPGDTSGMAFWEAALASGRATLADVRAAFATADEYKAEYANMTNTQIVSQVYMNLFGRLPDLAGLEFWTTQMARGVVTIDQVVAQVAAGAQNEDKIAFESKTQAAVAFTAALDDIKEVLAYETAAGQAIAKSYISGVKDAATLASSTTTAALDALTAQIVKAANLDDATRTVSLTNNIDVLTGNVFTSVPTYTPGGDEFINSLQDEDVLIGAGVNPTLNLTLGTANDGAETEIAPTLRGIETINARISGSAGATDGGTVTALNLADASGLKTINVERITGNAPVFEFRELDASVNTIKLANATNSGNVTFTHKEEVLTGTSEALDVTLTNVRNHAVNFQEGGDGVADTGFYFENISIAANGTNDIDTLNIQSNGREDLVAGNAADTTKQTLTITAGAAAGAAGSFEVNMLNATGVDTMTIHANHRVDIAADKAAALSAGDGLNTADLERLNIDGAANVRIDGLEGQVAAFGDTKGLTVAAGTMTGNLRVGVTGGTSADDLFALTSGSGNDEIRAFGNLGGDVATQDGNDTVIVSGNMLGTASINAGEGNNVVTAVDMLGAAASDRDLANNGGFDDIQAATIVTGSGNDVVTVRDLGNQSDWDNITITDGNNNDQQFIVGAMVDTGAGNDTINFRSVAEGAMVQAGEGDDAVNVTLGGAATVLAGDSQANRATLVTATNGVGTGRTDEVNRDGTVNRLGAIVDLGAGTADVANFTEVDVVIDTALVAPTETTNSTTLIVGQDAELRGAETVNVTALDRVNVTTTTTTVDQDGVTTGVQNDINANVIGTQNLNLTILNQIEDNVDDAVVAHTTIDGAVVNDNNATDGHIYADVMRFDSALQNIALVSQEAALQTGSATEVYEAGTRTEFSLDNMRSGINLSLRANEATGVAAGALRDDSQLVISSTTGLVTTNAAAADVRLNLNYDNARGLNDAAVLNVDAASGAFDLDLRIGATVTDVLDTDGDGNSATVANAASTTDDDTMRIENFTVNFADANSHSINANGFGDVVFRGATDRPAAVAGDVSSTAATSFTVNSAAAAGSTIAIDNVNADVIRVNNAAGTAVTAANVVVRVNANNNYDIRTGTGTDVIDMRADDVRSDDNATALDRADRIDAGTGRDTMIVSGTDNLGQNILPAITTTVDDDVFATLRGIEKILVDSDSAAGVQQITLDEQATTTGVDTIALVGAGNQTQRIVIGNNFVLANNTGDNANGQLTTAASAFVVDASMHTGMSSIAIESKDDDTDVALVNLDLRANSVGGANVNLVNTGDPSARVELRLTAAHEDDGFSLTSAVVGGGDGNVGLQVAAGNVDKIVISDMAGVSTVSHADATVTTAAEGAMTVNIDASWTGAAFELDMSGVADTDANQATGGATIRAAIGDTATLNIKGTANADNITGGRGADVIDGGAGNDVIVGDEVVIQNELEVVTFAATYDAGDVITVSHNGTTHVYNVLADGTTGAAVATFFAAQAWGSATAAFDGATRQLRLTGTTAGVDYAVTAAVNNAGDNVAQVQNIDVTTDGAYSLTVVFAGTSYTFANTDINGPSGATWTGRAGALAAAVVAAGGTATATSPNNLVLTGPTTGAAFPLVTQASVADPVTDSVALTVVAGDAGNDQANPLVVTETQARTVLGAADTIMGGAGNDTISGLTGADTLDGGAGVDTLDYSLSLGGVTVDIAANTASGGDAQGDVISNFEAIIGSAYNDVLTGNSLDNRLEGGAGNDTITGGAGIDTILAGMGADIVAGGTGNDIIDLGADTARDIVRFASGDGVDTVTGFLSTAVDMMTTDQIQFTDFADRDLIPTSLLQQTAAGNANALISGASTELLMVTGATTFVGGVTTANVAAALGAAFDMTALADGRVIFAIQVDTDGNGTTETVVGYYTDVGADDVIDAGNIEILGVVNGAVGTDNFWLPTV